MDNTKSDSSLGVVTTEICPACGHHEVGYRTHDGEFHTLRPGDVIRLVQAGQLPETNESPESHGEDVSGIGTPLSDLSLWVPDPVRGNMDLCLKYGVLIDRKILGEKMSADIYHLAFLQKLMLLIEKEEFIPLPVIFDRFFCAPNLASGTPRQIAERLLEEVDEVKEPLNRIMDWLVTGEDNILFEHEEPSFDQKDRTISSTEIKKAMEILSLEDFFEML